jgi:hypothetical protein
MKKIILISVLVVTTIFASAQHSKVRLNAYGSYVFEDGFDVYNDANTYYNGKIKAGVQWGGGIEYVPYENGSVELLYFNKSSDVPTNFKFGSGEPARTENFSLTQHYILLAGNGLKMSSSKKVEGYASLMAGVLISDVTSPTKNASGSNTDFAWGGRLGLNLWASQKVGIKLQAQILSSAKATGGDTYWGYWGPVYLSTYTAIWQFGLGGGLTFRLGK